MMQAMLSSCIVGCHPTALMFGFEVHDAGDALLIHCRLPTYYLTFSFEADDGGDALCMHFRLPIYCLNVLL